MHLGDDFVHFAFHKDFSSLHVRRWLINIDGLTAADIGDALIESGVKFYPLADSPRLECSKKQERESI